MVVIDDFKYIKSPPNRTDLKGFLDVMLLL